MVESTKPVVVITGVSGYLGSHVALVFLKDGSYSVRGTVRDTKNPKKVEPLRKAFGEYFNQMTLVEADLENKDSLFAAIKGADFVVHTASPFPIKAPKHENELINPAVNGTLAVMEAAHANKVKRVVITSSIAAIMSSRPENTPPNRVFTEKNWSDPIGDHIDPYSKSKTLAEQSAWKFLENLPADQRFELATINPGLIFGPAFVGAGFSSGEIIEKFINGSVPALPKVQFACVDVRDCADAHLQAIKRPEAAGKRFILVQRSVWFKEIAQILSKEFKSQGWTKIPSSDLPKWVATVGSWFMSDLKLVMKNWDVETTFANEQSKQILGINYSIPMDQTINDMAYSMIETGVLQDKRKK